MNHAPIIKALKTIEERHQYYINVDAFYHGDIEQLKIDEVLEQKKILKEPEPTKPEPEELKELTLEEEYEKITTYEENNGGFYTKEIYSFEEFKEDKIKEKHEAEQKKLIENKKKESEELEALESTEFETEESNDSEEDLSEYNFHADKEPPEPTIEYINGTNGEPDPFELDKEDENHDTLKECTDSRFKEDSKGEVLSYSKPKETKPASYEQSSGGVLDENQNFRASLNEKLKYTDEAKSAAKDLLKQYCAGRRTLGKKKEMTENLLELIVNNCIYYNKYRIYVSMSKNKKNYISENGINRSPATEIKLILFLEENGFINRIAGDSYQTAKRDGVLAKKTSIRITEEAFNKYKDILKFIKKPYDISDLPVYARDTLKIKGKKEHIYLDLEKNFKLLSEEGKKSYNKTLKIVNDYNMLIKETKVFCEGLIPYQNKKINCIYGITKDLETKGRLCATITNNKKHIRKNYLINDLKTIELDYSCMHIGMLFHKNGHVLQEDFYKINGYDADCRPTIKVIVNIVLNKRAEKGTNAFLLNEMKKYDKNLNSEIEIAKKTGRKPIFSLPKGIFTPDSLSKRKGRLQLIRATIKKLKDSPIEHELFRGGRKDRNEVSDSIGMYLMRHESKIAEQIIKHFTGKKILVLPVYDSFIICEKYAIELKKVMHEAYFKEFGFDPVGIS